MAVAAYTGNGAYCFSNALHMSLLAAGADPSTLPETWFVECLTAMPFGRAFSPDGPAFGICAPGWNSDRDGLPLAIEALGWRCRTWRGGSADEALERLRAALAAGPAWLGPLDFGYLSYHRGARGMAGFDHHVVGLALTEEGLLLHDPAGCPYAVLPIVDLLDAWRAESIGWALGPYTLRSHFERERAPTRAEMIARVLPAARANVRREAGRPGQAAGHRALRELARVLRDGPPEGLERQLIVFSLPTAARRAVDAARFLAEAGLPAAASAMGREAVLWGRSCSAVARRDWSGAAELVDRLADAEQELAGALR
jgi:hypothetical protein